MKTTPCKLRRLYVYSMLFLHQGVCARADLYNLECRALLGVQHLFQLPASLGRAQDQLARPQAQSGCSAAGRFVPAAHHATAQ